MKIYLLLVLLVLVNCAGSIDEYVNLTGEYKAKNSQEVDIKEVSYILPSFVCSGSLEDSLQYLNFPTMKQEREYIRIFTRFYANAGENEYILEKRKDNYGTGSGVKYILNIQRQDFNNSSCVISIHPKKRESYREGVWTIATPQFDDVDVEDFFQSVSMNFDFSLISPYTAEPTYGSLERILNLNERGKLSGETQMVLNDKKVFIDIKVYPYRSGSMVKVWGKTYVKFHNQKLNFDRQIKEIKERLHSIAQS